MEGLQDYELAQGMADDVSKHGIDAESLVSPNEDPVFEKYDEYVPPSLLRRAYAVDKLAPREAEKRIVDIYNEYAE